MSDLLDVEKIPKVGNSSVLTYNESVLNHISLLKILFAAYKVGLYITVIELRVQTSAIYEIS